VSLIKTCVKKVNCQQNKIKECIMWYGDSLSSSRTFLVTICDVNKWINISCGSIAGKT